MKRKGTLLVSLVLAALIGCRSGKSLIHRSEDPNTPGTIAGILRAQNDDRLPGRNVHAVNVETARRYSVVTSVTGGFSIPVPPGKYRLEVELQPGEKILSEPGVIDINESDLDANLEIVIGS